MIAIDLSKKQALDADQKAIQQINFTGNLDWGGGFRRSCEIIVVLFCFSIISI